ncbi:toll-like receptor [Cricetulus griseus]|nr:toll-like receptor [Cricetulus griseus]
MKSLDLSNNKITSIGHGDLRGCVNLRALILQSSGINTIEEDAFSSLSKLEYLDLSDNHLSNLSSSWFRPLSSLKYLNLLGNPYRILGETPLFLNLTHLQTLRVGNVATFSGIRRTDFAGLTSLDELEIKALSLQNYEPGSLQSIQSIHHLTFHLSQSDFLLGVFEDTLSSVGYLELRDANLDSFYFSELSTDEMNSPMKKLAFQNADLTDESFNELLKLLRYTPELLEVEFDDCTLNGVGDFQPSESDVVRELGKVETLIIRRLHIPRFYSFYDLSTVYTLLEKEQAPHSPDASLFPVLLVMKIRENAISTFSKDQLSSFPKLVSLEAGGNHFICSCELLSFTLEHPALVQVLAGWPDSYLCDSPSRLRGQRVQDARPSVLECHQTLLVSGVCCALVLLILLIGGLCHHFHGLWYLRMMWAWLQAKRKPKKAPCRDICYDAFVSYSEQDSYWVENLMVQQLENSEPPFKLCLHKRDFVPGKWIIDNIIDSIEKSHKTLFVLSENFVRSEWCKYELDFSHFRLFDENNDAGILVLLEPIEKKAIPQRFCKLRKIMNTKTYLEWPLDEGQQEVFWIAKISLQY